MPHGMITPHAGIDGLALGIRRAGLADAAVREDAMAAVKPAVGAQMKLLRVSWVSWVPQPSRRA